MGGAHWPGNLRYMPICMMLADECIKSRCRQGEVQRQADNELSA